MTELRRITDNVRTSTLVPGLQQLVPSASFVEPRVDSERRSASARPITSLYPSI